MKKSLSSIALSVFLCGAANAQQPSQLSKADECLLQELRDNVTKSSENYLLGGHRTEFIHQPRFAQNMSRTCESWTGDKTTAATDHLRRDGFGMSFAPALNF